MVFPQISFSPYASVDLTLGAFLYVGDADTKFGSPLTGPSTVFLKAKMTF